MKRPGWKSLALVIVGLALVVTMFAPSGAADERRVVVSIDEPFEVNGQIYPAGQVTVKSIRTYNPSSLLSEIWVGRDCLGVFRASRISDDAPTANQTVTFKRTAAGHLSLVGFASGKNDTQGVYRFRLQAKMIDSESPVVAR